MTIDRGSVKLGTEERFLMVARYKDARLEFHSASLDVLHELSDHLLKIGCVGAYISSDRRGPIGDKMPERPTPDASAGSSDQP